MILASLLAVAIFPGRFVEESIPSARSNLIEAAIVFPYLTPKDRAIEEVIAASLLEGTADYTKVQMREASILVGEPLRCVATPDCLRITIGTKKGDWKTGLRILKSLLTAPDLSEDSMDHAKATLPFMDRSPWRSAVDPSFLSYESVEPRDVRDFLMRNMTPEAVSIFLTGSLNPGEPRAFWLDAIADWNPARRPRFKADRRLEFITRRPDLPVSILRWDGPEIAPSSGRLPAALLAAFALGVGKDCAVFRVIREKERLSYRQEAFLAPYGEGFRLQIVTAFRPREDEMSLPSQIRTDMLADIATWNEATRMRAVEMARASLANRAMPIPLGITPEGVVSGADLTFLKAYWPLKTGQVWNSREMMTTLESVTLEGLKSVAGELIEKGTSVQSQ